MFRCAPDCALCCRVSPVTVLPHEVYVLDSLAKDLGVAVRFSPAYTLADRYSGVRVALSYLMHLDEEGKCPFLRGTRCLVHDLYKPLTCRSFPYLPKVIKYELDPAAREIRMEINFVISTLCPVVKADLTPGDVLRMSNVRVAAKYAPREVEVAKEAVDKRFFYARALSDLWRKDLVDLVDGREQPHWPVVNGFSFLRRFKPELTIKELI
ncbi:MAG: YkgJ family cysteine cluster protein [Thermoproteus sp.]|nr:YkgJ family cysteine cluster protein [Thermoproteus sp.]